MNIDINHMRDELRKTLDWHQQEVTGIKSKDPLTRHAEASNACLAAMIFMDKIIRACEGV